jgi:hypothetical protein
MKKFLSLIALVGVFAACQPEKVQTAFSLAGGDATINVKVLDIIQRAEYPSTQYTLAASEGTINNNTSVYITAAENSKLDARTVTLSITGPKLAKTYTYEAQVPEVLAGGHAVVNAIIVVGEGADFTFDVVPTSKVPSTKRSYLVNTHYPSVEEEGISWYINDSEFLLDAEVEYDTISGAEWVGAEPKLGFEVWFDAIKETIEEAGGKTVEKLTGTFPVSAYAMWTAYVDYTTDLCTYTVNATNNKTGEKLVAGTFQDKEFSNSKMTPEEKAYPKAHGHYTHGHGISGDTVNAGGGIVEAQ